MTERPTGIFSDVHAEDGKVRATLLHDPTVEGLDTAIYVDGSGSMADEYGRPGLLSRFFHWLVGKSAPSGKNIVEPQIHRMLEYLASKDRNGSLRVAYWSDRVEVVGELTAAAVATHKFNGPQYMGGTQLKPALLDYVEYMRAQAKAGAQRGCAVIITDGQLSDASDVMTFSESIAGEMNAGTLPPLNFVLVGVGSGVDEHQLEEICHQEYGGRDHMWCHRIAEEMTEIAQLVAVLVDESMTIASSGRVLDDRGNVLQVYEGRLPAVLEFAVPRGCKEFVLEVNGQPFRQAIPAEHH